LLYESTPSGTHQYAVGGTGTHTITDAKSLSKDYMQPSGEPGLLNLSLAHPGVPAG